MMTTVRAPWLLPVAPIECDPDRDAVTQEVATAIASTAGWNWVRCSSEMGAEPALEAAASWPSALSR